MKSGGTVVYPTETSYALGTAATSSAGVQKIYRAKQRPREKVLPVVVSSVSQAKIYFSFSRTDAAITERFWPGALSLVLKVKSKSIRRALGSSTAAVRCSSNPIAVQLATLVGAPIVSTSANVSGQPGCASTTAVRQQFAGRNAKPDFYVNGGKLAKSLPSTIVRTRGTKIFCVREGAVPVADLGDALVA